MPQYRPGRLGGLDVVRPDGQPDRGLLVDLELGAGVCHELSGQRYIALVPSPAGHNVGNVNPTPWIIAYDGYRSDGSEPQQPCAS